MRPRSFTPRALASIALSLLAAGCVAENVEPASAETATRVLVVGGPAGNEYAFAPADLATRVGRSIDVRFRNDGAEPHTFTVMALGADTGTVAPGDEATLTLKPAKAGTFQIVCAIPGHVELGMTGTLRVSGA